jgi:para-nitrobenzyl esterase
MLRRQNNYRGAVLLGSLLATAMVSTAAIGGTSNPVVTTKDGQVQGFVKDGVDEFLGIPYAAPPVGALRWRPPAAPAKHGPLDATQFANTCPQVTELGAFAGPSSTTEDCLYLNVFTTGESGPAKPVLVWIHGGGNVDGETDDYDGGKVATGGPLGTPTVVVTVNYRLGLFGFLSEKDLNAEGHPFANYGILDQQAALKWVRANIAAFGGDPGNVTLGGQSAGAINTTANVISPAAKGLFQRAIFQSSPIPNQYFLVEADAVKLGNSFATAAGCADAACLRALSAERILQLQGTANANGPFVFGGAIVDGTIVPLLPEAAWKTGKYQHMPMLGGTTKDDGGGNFGLSIAEYFSGPPQVAVTLAEYDANSVAVKAQYPLASYGNDPQLAQDRIGADPFKCDGRRVLNELAKTNSGFSVYGYDFTYQDAPYYFPQMPNAESPTGHFQPLAAHTSDIQFVFQGYHGGNLGVNLDQTSGLPRELKGKEITLSDQIVGAWTRFANTGNPNGPKLPTWQAFTSGKGPFLQQDIPNAVETDAQYSTNYKCAFWATQ